jgi:hypothetical protein
MKFDKKGLLPSISLALLSAFALLTADACKDKDGKVDCSSVSGATFSTNSGKISSILETKCSTANCHAAGGLGSAHWTWSANYDDVKQHFDHMLESVDKGTMPKSGSPTLTDGEKDQLECWKNAGYPK